MADTSSTERHPDSISRPLATSSASSFDIPSFSLLSVQQNSSSTKENGHAHNNTSHMKSSASLQKLLHYTNNDDTTLASPNHFHSTAIESSGSAKRDNDESRILRELLFGMQGIETPRLSSNDASIDRCTRILINRFLECGWLYEKIRKLINTPSTSLVAQAFMANLSSELREYHRLISVIEQQVTMQNLSKVSLGFSLCRRMCREWYP